MKKYLGLAAIIALVSVLLSGCSGYGTPANPPPTTTATTSPGQSTNAVTIFNYSFAPGTLTVKVGTTVTWTNKDGFAHTVTADDNSFNSGNVAANATYSHTFSKAGTFAYHCSIHTYMKGTVIVQ